MPLRYLISVLGVGSVSGKAAETWRAEQQHSRTREDSLFLLARSGLQHQRERNLGLDDGGAGQPQRVTGGCLILMVVSLASPGTRSLSSPVSGSISGWNVISVYLIGCAGVGE